MKYRKVLPHVVFVLLVGGFVLLSNPSLKQSQTIKSPLTNNRVFPTRETAKVLKVVDGDTIKVLMNNKEETVRLIGIDSPEVLDERKPVQCFGKEASDKAKEILTGKTIVLESDPTQEDKDEYGRLLRYVFLDDLNFNKFMVSEGYAREYTFKGKSYKQQLEFEDMEGRALESKKGLWADNACN